MKTKIFKYLLFLCFIQIFISCYSAGSYRSYDYYPNQTKTSETSFNDQMPVEPGKCYAKSLIPDRYDIVNRKIMVYTGDDINSEAVSYEKFILKPAKTKWEKQSMKESDYSASEKVMVWCLVNIPEETKELYIVTDTLIEKAFEIQQIQQEVLVKKGGHTEWKEVVCEKDLTPKFIMQLKTALTSQGFGKNMPMDGSLSGELKEELIKYQKQTGLPVGNINVETLDALGVDY